MIFKLDVLFYNILYGRTLILYKNIVKQKVEQTISEYGTIEVWKEEGQVSETGHKRLMVFSINWLDYIN